MKTLALRRWYRLHRDETVTFHACSADLAAIARREYRFVRRETDPITARKAAFGALVQIVADEVGP